MRMMCRIVLFAVLASWCVGQAKKPFSIADLYRLKVIGKKEPHDASGTKE